MLVEAVVDMNKLEGEYLLTLVEGRKVKPMDGFKKVPERRTHSEMGDASFIMYIFSIMFFELKM